MDCLTSLRVLSLEFRETQHTSIFTQGTLLEEDEEDEEEEEEEVRVQNEVKNDDMLAQLAASREWIVLNLINLVHTSSLPQFAATGIITTDRTDAAETIGARLTAHVPKSMEYCFHQQKVKRNSLITSPFHFRSTTF